MSEIEQPGCEARVATTASRAALTQLREDIENARCEADVVVISIHWGLHFTPAAIADYETEIGRAAIDFGADLILGHHQHILKGIQVYKGKAIFHGLGNFVLDVPSSQLANPGVQEMQHNNPSYAVARYADYPSYPFHPDARRTAIARVLIEDGKVIRVGFLPCLIDRTGTPQVVKHGTPEFDDVVTYMIEISEKAGFPTEFDFISDEVFVRTE
jgi:poly-gamma-glutamate synthesis protein (capsule biosynthesis protein)